MRNFKPFVCVLERVWIPAQGHPREPHKLQSRDSSQQDDRENARLLLSNGALAKSKPELPIKALGARRLAQRRGRQFEYQQLGRTSRCPRPGPLRLAHRTRLRDRARRSLQSTRLLQIRPNEVPFCRQPQLGGQ
jgi:hypothetical protein